MDIFHTCIVAARGYHYCKQFWKPVENKELRYLYEKFNFYDSFPVKTGEIVGHLPRKVLPVTIFFG